MNNSDDQKGTPGWVEKKQPDGTTRYYPDDKTNDEIRRDAVSPQQTKTDQASAEAATHLEDSNNALVKGWDWLWKPRITPEHVAKFWATTLFNRTQEQQEKEEEHALATGKTGTAQVRRAERGVADTLGRVTAPLTSVGSIASLGAEGLEAVGLSKVAPFAKYLTPLLKMPGYTGVAVFGIQGAKEMTTEKQEGESDADAMERRLLGASAFFGSAGAAGAMTREMLGKTLVSTFGLNEDLAAKVADRVEKLRVAREARDSSLGAIENDRDAKLSSLDSDTKRQVASFEAALEQDMEKIRSTTLERHRSIDQFSQEAIDASKGRVDELHRTQLHAGAQIMSDTVQVIREMEGDRDIEGSLGKPFREVGEKVKGNLTTQAGIYDLIKSKFAERKIQLGELPSAATKALGKDQSATGEQLAGLDLSRIVGGGVETEGRNLTFNDLTRIREDLYQASESGKDANVSAALKEASESVADMQQKAADAAGVGQKYRDARMDYMVFKRGLGSGLMKKWLSAADVADQDMQAKVGKLMATDKAATRAIRTTLKAAGIDTGPLDELVRAEARETASQKAIAASKKGPTGLGKGVEEVRRADTVTLKKGTQEEIARVKGAATEQEKAIVEDAKKRGEVHQDTFKQAEKHIERVPVVPGFDSTELVGKGNEELYRMKMKELAERNKGVNVTAAVMVMYGVLHASAFPLLYGLARGGLPELVKTAAFQDWVIQQAGIAPKTPQANRMRRAIAQMGPLLTKGAKSGVPQAAAVGAAKSIDLGNVPTREDQPNQ